MLDRAIEEFIETALHQAYFGLGHENNRATWSDFRTHDMAGDMRPLIFAAPWLCQGGQGRITAFG